MTSDSKWIKIAYSTWYTSKSKKTPLCYPMRSTSGSNCMLGTMSFWKTVYKTQQNAMVGYQSNNALLWQHRVQVLLEHYTTPWYTLVTTWYSLRSSCTEMSCKKGVLSKFAKSTEKRLCQSLFFSKVAGLSCFPVNFAKFLRTLILKEHLRWVLLTCRIDPCM